MNSVSSSSSISSISEIKPAIQPQQQDVQQPNPAKVNLALDPARLAKPPTADGAPDLFAAGSEKPNLTQLFSTLKAVDINATSLPPGLSESPELYAALQVRGLAVDSPNEEQKQQIISLVNDLHQKFDNDQPLVPRLDIQDTKLIKSIATNLAQVLDAASLGGRAEDLRNLAFDETIGTAENLARSLAYSIETSAELLPETDTGRETSALLKKLAAQLHSGAEHAKQSQVANPALSAFQSKDDSMLGKNPVISVLENAGVDTKNYSIDFLQSPELLDAMKQKGLMFDKSEGTGTEVTSLVDELSAKYVQGKSLVPTKDLSKDSEILSVASNVANSLEQAGLIEAANGLRDSLSRIQTIGEPIDNFEAGAHVGDIQVDPERKSAALQEGEGRTYANLESNEYIAMDKKHNADGVQLDPARIADPSVADAVIDALDKALQKFPEDSNIDNFEAGAHVGDIQVDPERKAATLQAAAERTYSDLENTGYDAKDKEFGPTGVQLDPARTSKQELQELREAVQGLKIHLGAASISKAKDEIKAALLEQMADLAKPGTSIESKVGVSFVIPLAGIAGVELEVDFSKSYKTSNTLSIKVSNEVNVTPLAGITLPFVRAMGGPLVGTYDRSTVVKSAEFLVDNEADKLISTLARMPVTSAKNAQKFTQFKDAVKNMHDIRNNTEKLTEQLKTIGALEEDDSLAIPQQEETEKKLPKKRYIRQHAPLVGRIASGLSSFASIQADAEAILPRYTKQTDIAPERPLSALGDFPQELNFRLEKYAMEDLGTLNSLVESHLKNESLEDAGDTLATIKALLLENLETYEQYSSGVRERDTHLPLPGGTISNLSKNISKHLTPEGKETKSEIEGQLQTSGRVETFDKLITRQAELTRLYNELSGSDMAAPAASRQSIESRFEELDLSVEGHENKAKEKQFKEALETLNKSLDDPNVSFSKNELDDLRVKSKVVNRQKTRVAKLEVQLTPFGKAAVEVEFAKRDHFDPLRANKLAVTMKVEGTGVLSSDNIATIVQAAQQGIQTSNDPEVAKAYSEAFTGLQDHMGAELSGGKGIEIEIFNGAKSFSREFTSTSVGVSGGGVDIGLAAVNLTAASSKTTSTIEKLGTDSFFQLQSQFNTLFSAQKLAKGDTDIDTVDGWTELAGANAEEFTQIVTKTLDPNSGPSKYFDMLLEHINEYAVDKDKTTGKMNERMDKLRESAAALKEANLSGDELKASAEFKQVVEDQRQVMSLYGKDVIKVAKELRETTVNK